MAAAIGNDYAAKGAKWNSAIRRAIARNDGSLNRIADKLLEMAESGDMAAIKEIGDRLDGKPKQALVGGDPNDAPIRHAIAVSYVDPSDSAA